MSQPPAVIDPASANIYSTSSSEIWAGTSFFGDEIDIRIGGINLQSESGVVTEFGIWFDDVLLASIFNFSLSGSELTTKLQQGISGLTFGSDEILGSEFRDILIGGRGNDEIFGFGGSDSINGGPGSDYMSGGNGEDTAVFSKRDNRIDLRITSRQSTGEGRDRLISIENVNAGGGKDLIIGNGKNNKLIGGGGADRINGKGGNDLLIGGGGGIDRLKGEKGRDTFRVVKGTGYTIVEDFKDGVDRIQLGSGTSGIKINNRNGDAFVYQNGDLIARVDDAARDLQRSGQFLV